MYVIYSCKAPTFTIRLSHTNLAFFAFFLLLEGLIAQQPFSKNYQTNEGLPSNYIYFVFQDRKGYIWTSSDVGVSRFDGQSFVHYNTSHGMPDNEVFSICEDQAGRLWFATLNGKVGFYHNGAIYNEHNFDFLKRCDIKGLVINLFQQADGRVVYCGVYKTILPTQICTRVRAECARIPALPLTPTISPICRMLATTCRMRLKLAGFIFQSVK